MGVRKRGQGRFDKCDADASEAHVGILPAAWWRLLGSPAVAGSPVKACGLEGRLLFAAKHPVYQ